MEHQFPIETPETPANERVVTLVTDLIAICAPSQNTRQANDNGATGTSEHTLDPFNALAHALGYPNRQPNMWWLP